MQQRTNSLLAAVLIFALAFSSSLQARTDYTIRKEKSRIGFIADSRFGEVPGTFKEWRSTVSVSHDLSEVSGNIIIQIRSIDTGNSGRDDHLRNPDFFHAEKFPTATFQPESIVRGDGGITVSGKLTIRGITRDHSIRFSTSRHKDGIRLVGQSSINRKDFKIDYDSLLNPIEDQVMLKISVELGG